MEPPYEKDSASSFPWVERNYRWEENFIFFKITKISVSKKNLVYAIHRRRHTIHHQQYDNKNVTKASRFLIQHLFLSSDPKVSPLLFAEGRGSSRIEYVPEQNFKLFLRTSFGCANTGEDVTHDALHYQSGHLNFFSLAFSSYVLSPCSTSIQAA